MAEELDPVTQVFEADGAEYEAWLESAAMTAQEFADANEEAKLATDGLRDSAAEAGAALDGNAGSAIAAGEAMSFTRDEWLAASEAAARIRDEAAQAAAAEDALAASAATASGALDDLFVHSDAVIEAQNGMRDSAVEAGAALGHERDEALEASEAVKSLRDSEVEAAAAGDAAAAGGISMMAVGITALIGLIAAVAPAAVAMGAGFAAAGVFAIPVITQITGGLTQISADQQAYNRALTATAKNTALAHLKQDWAAIPAPIQDTIKAIQSLEATWKSWAKYFQPETLTAFDEALSIARDLMTEILPLASQGFFAINGALEQIKAAIDSSGFRQFLADMSRMVIPATNAFMRLAGVILGILGQALEQLAPLSVPFINMLSTLLQAAGPALIGALRFIAEVLMDIGKAITPLLGPLGKVIGYMADHPIFAQMATAILGIVVAVKLWAIAQGILNAVMEANPWVLLAIALIALAILIATHTHQIAHAFDVVRHAVATFGHDVMSVLDTVRHTVASWGHDIAHTFDTVRHDVAIVGHDIVAGLSTAANWIASHWKVILAWLVDPIGMAVFEIKSHTHQIATAFDDMRHLTANILDTWRHDIASAFDTARHNISAWADEVPHDIAAGWDAARHLTAQALDNIRHDIAAGFDNARHDIAAALAGARHDIASWIDDVLHFFAQLPGQISNFLSKLPGEMLSIGENVIRGLINGILNEAAQIPSIMSGLASDVASYFTDPLKLFSPSRLFFEHGANIVQGLINGVKANAPALLATMRGLGTGVGATGSTLAAGAIAPAGGSTTVHVPVQVNAQGMTPNYNDPRFTQYIQGVVQEGVLRYGQLNPGNGLTPAWGR